MAPPKPAPGKSPPSSAASAAATGGTPSSAIAGAVKAAAAAAASGASKPGGPGSTVPKGIGMARPSPTTPSDSISGVSIGATPGTAGSTGTSATASSAASGAGVTVKKTTKKKAAGGDKAKGPVKKKKKIASTSCTGGASGAGSAAPSGAGRGKVPINVGNSGVGAKAKGVGNVGKEDVLHPAGPKGVPGGPPVVGPGAKVEGGPMSTTSGVLMPPKKVPAGGNPTKTVKKGTKKPKISAQHSAVANINFSSTAPHSPKKPGGKASSKTSPSKHQNPTAKSAGTSSNASALMAPKMSEEMKIKIQRGQIAKKELMEMDAIERAFREDTEIWLGPEIVDLPGQDGGGAAKNTPSPYPLLYGSQSQGWMYREGFAGIGGRSWMEATSAAASMKNTEVDATNNLGVTDKTSPNEDALKSMQPSVVTSDSKMPTPMTTSSEDPMAKTQPQTADTVENPNVPPVTSMNIVSPVDVDTKPNGFLMNDVKIIENALRANGLTREDVTPKAYACFLEQARRYALELLADAQDYAIHANRSTLPSLLPSDLILAADLRGDVHGVPSSLPTFEDMSEFASEVNRIPLPPIPSNCYNGVALPPVEQQLTARTFDVVNGARVVQRMMRGGEVPTTAYDLGPVKKGNKAMMDAVMTNSGSGPGKAGGDMPPSMGMMSAGPGPKFTAKSSTAKKKKSNQGSYGARKGGQIAVHIKSHKNPTAPGGSVPGMLSKGSGPLGAMKGVASVSVSTAASSMGGVGGAKSTTSSKSGVKVQKRKLTEL